jgi:hypothetical protein
MKDAAMPVLKSLMRLPIFLVALLIAVSPGRTGCLFALSLPAGDTVAIQALSASAAGSAVRRVDRSRPDSPRGLVSESLSFEKEEERQAAVDLLFDWVHVSDGLALQVGDHSLSFAQGLLFESPSSHQPIRLRC